MMTLESLSEDMLVTGISKREQALAESYLERIVNPVRSGQTLSAQVLDDEDEYDELHDVSLTVHPESILASCTCEGSGRCRHAFALLLKWLRHPAAFAGPGEAPAATPPRRLAVTPVPPPATQRPEQWPAWAATTFAERQEGYVEQLAETLGALRLQDLRDVARRRGWRLKGTDKAGITLQMARAMAAHRGTQEAALALDEEHRRVLAAMALSGASAKMEDIARVVGALGGLTQQKQLDSCVQRLFAMGLALATGHGAYTACCPHQLVRGLLPLVQRTILAEAEPARPAAAEERLADPFPFVRTVSEIALLLERAPIALRPPMPRPTAERQFPGLRGWDYDAAEVAQAQEGRRLRPHADLILTVPPPQPSLLDEAIAELAPTAGGAGRLEFIYELLVATGIVQPGSPVTAWPEVRRQYLCRNELEQRAALARSYFGMANWSELWTLWHLPGGSPVQIKRHAGYAYYTEDRLRSDLAAARLLALRVLACLPDDRWVSLGELFRLLRPVWPRFDEVLRQPGYYAPSAGWFLARRGSDARFAPMSDAEWDLVQGNVLRVMLSGPLHWLGLADLRLEGGALTAFRLHGLADLFWDQVDAPPAPPSAAPAAPSSVAAVTVQGTRISVRPSAISAQAHGLLERIARLAEATAGRFDYELDAEATYHAFEAGAALADIAAEWQRLLPMPMPEAIRAQLERWWRAYGRVRVYQALTVIEFADDYALAEMKAVTSLARHIVAEISPRLVMIDHAAADTLVAELEKAGYTPKRTDQV